MRSFKAGYRRMLTWVQGPVEPAVTVPEATEGGASEELKAAYRDWLAAPVEDRAYLCWWLCGHDLSNLESEQAELLTRSGLNYAAPFAHWIFSHEHGDNPGRIAWVEHILAGRAPEDFKLPQFPEES